MNQNKGFKASVAGLFSAALVLGALPGCSQSSTAGGKTGTFHGEGQGFGGVVSADVTFDNGKITDVVLTGDNETPTVGGAALGELAEQVKKAGSAEIDGVSSATLTSNGVKAAVQAAIDATEEGVSAHENVPVTYTAGTYTGKAEGYNGPVELTVTFAEDGIENIEVASSKETAHVGDVAYDIMFADAKEANGSGIDSVSGATFTSKAVKDALADAAEQAGASDLDGFKANTVAHEAGEDMDLGTFDVIVVGAGGAGMGAAAQAAQNGLSVLVLEENAEVGGNTLVSGGQFQATMPYLAWDINDPEATTAVWDYDGKTYDKVKASQGQLHTLKTILNWDEKPFEYAADEEFEAGNIDTLAPHGVHAEYLETLKELKKEIQAYVDYAEKKMAAGAKETDLVLFSTDNLHIFQTYYGGLRRTADGSEWIYGDYDLVKQFCTEGYDLKTWLEDQGAVFNDAAAITLIGALWYRENINMGCDLDGDGNVDAGGNWGTYFAPTINTITKTASTAADNKIQTRTTVKNLIVEDGKVVGVEGEMYDGTKVTARANGGVVLTTGGYAANVDMIVENNKYWDKSYVTSSIKTTNRSSLQGDGITMAEEVDADTTGMGFAQMMPISWIDNGNLAFGNGLYANYISPVTGKRFVDESAERDVLSLGEFANGATVNGVNGVFMEITNWTTDLTYPYPYNVYSKPGVLAENGIGDYDVENRVYNFSSREELKEIMDQFGFTADVDTIYETITQYDKDMKEGNTESDGVRKEQFTYPIGEWDEDGNYKLDGVKLRVRLMAPSTHHTMGGLKVDTERHVLDTEGNAIEGLYAAGEVTGGIHAGNRLGGNAIVEIFVSGRTAANTIADEMK